MINPSDKLSLSLLPLIIRLPLSLLPLLTSINHYLSLSLFNNDRTFPSEHLKTPPCWSRRDLPRPWLWPRRLRRARPRQREWENKRGSHITHTYIYICICMYKTIVYTYIYIYVCYNTNLYNCI